MGSIVIWTVAVITLSAYCEGLSLTQYDASSDLTKAVIDIKTGNLYIGGENILLQLDKDLQLQGEVHRIGPEYDSDKCFAPPATCSHAKSYVSNKISVLAINSVHSYLLACGTIHQGLCYIHSLSDLKTKELNATNHASFVGSKTMSSVAFFGRPPIGRNETNRLLYAAMATYDRTEFKFSPPTISTRELVYDSTTQRIGYYVDNENLGLHSYLDVYGQILRNFRVKYIFGFELNGSGYYVSIQPVDKDLGKTKYVTKLIQFCQDDTSYRTYIESTMMCQHGQTTFNLATAAYMHYSESNSKHFLSVSFGQASTSKANEVDPQKGSVMCHYEMGFVRQHFRDLQKSCYNAGNGYYPWWIHGNVRQCEISSSIFNPKDYCDYDLTQTGNRLGISGNEDDPESILLAEADVCIDEMITAILLTDQQSHPISFLGTADGELVKVRSQTSLKADSCEGNKPYMKYKLSNDSILQDMLMDPKKEYAYVMSGKKITKFPLESCEVYSECSSCVSSKDPMGCGWCGDHCSKKDECVNGAWSHDTCKPYITSFEPQSGPTAGGTLLTITGNNFGYKIPTVKIGEVSCRVDGVSLSNKIIKCTTEATESDMEGSLAVQVSVTDLTLDKMNYKVDGIARTTDIKFEYKKPILSEVFPLYGPESGGTNITLTGDHFDIGLQTSVSIGSITCPIFSLKKTEILCRTGKAPGLLGTGRRRRAVRVDFVTLAIDGAKLYSTKHYEYKKDAVIVSLDPSTTIHNGGTSLTVTGSNLDTVQHPQIGVKLSTGDEALGNCTANPDDEGKKMVCIMPNILPLMGTLDQSVLQHIGGSVDVTLRRVYAKKSQKVVYFKWSFLYFKSF